MREVDARAAEVGAPGKSRIDDQRSGFVVSAEGEPDGAVLVKRITTFYGFATADDLALFELLIGVSGIGPRAALALLSALDYPQLTRAIVSGQTDALRRVPGVGQKTAERLVLELRDKVTPPIDNGASPQRPPREPSRDEEVIAALIGLGYSQSEATDAAAAVDGADAALEERIRLALRGLAKA